MELTTYERNGRLAVLRHYALAVGAIFVRDLKVYLRYPANAIFQFIDPFVWMLPMVFMARAFMVGGKNIGFAAYTGTTDYVAYWIVGGIIGFYVQSTLWGMGFSLRNEMWQGVIETNWLTPVPVVVQLVGRSLWQIAITTFKSVVGLLIAWIGFGLTFTDHILPALITLVPILIGLYGLGFGLAAVVLVTNDANNAIDISGFAMNILSGQQFPVQLLPRLMLVVSLTLPITYGIDAVRGYMLGTPTLLAMWQEQLILLGVMAGSVALGYIIFRWVERRVRAAGNLGFH